MYLVYKILVVKALILLPFVDVRFYVGQFDAKHYCMQVQFGWGSLYLGMIVKIHQNDEEPWTSLGPCCLDKYCYKEATETLVWFWFE
jgi:hypothetical protein